jgi:hypothetical protein
VARGDSIAFCYINNQNPQLFNMTDYEVSINNSAGRLVCLLKKTIVMGQENENQTYISAVCEALELPATAVNHSESLSNLFYLIQNLLPEGWTEIVQNLLPPG